ncbi:MAG TPA: hypothetical protein VG651_13770 [Stellaceae bacterium]|nr:hypothetical protein [Stellaceae bacterium]
MNGAVITLGGREFTIAPLRLGQLRALLDALDDLSGKSGGAMVEAAARVVQAGLSRGLPDMTLDRVLELEATMDELTAAVSVILRAAGLAPQGETRPGEAMPVATVVPA